MPSLKCQTTFITILSLSFLILSGCQPQTRTEDTAVTFTVKGHTSLPEGTKLTLLKKPDMIPLGKNSRIKNSHLGETYVHNGQYLLEAQVPHAGVYEIDPFQEASMTHYDKLELFIEPNMHYEVQDNSNNSTIQYHVTSKSENQPMLEAYNASGKKYLQRHQLLTKQIELATNNPDTTQESLLRAQRNTLDSMYTLFVDSQLYAYKDYAIAGYMMCRMNDLFSDTTKYINLLKTLGPAAQQSWYGKSFMDYIQSERLTGKGKPCPLPVGITPEGSRAIINFEKHRFTLLVFWKSNDYECRKLQLKLRPLYRQYASKGFEVLGISFDEHKPDWIKAIGDQNLPWPQLSDLSPFSRSKNKEAFNVSYIPFTILVDQQGKILDKNMPVSNIERFVTRSLN